MSYCATLAIHRLRLMVNLGRWDDERAERQPIEVTVKLHFPSLPEAYYTDDNDDVFCYDNLATDIKTFVADRQFNLIEYLTQELHKLTRANIVTQRGEDYAAGVWVTVHLNKCDPPIDGLMGGSSFTFTDLPEGLYESGE